MNSRLIASNGSRTYVLIFEDGEEAKQGMIDFARGQEMYAAHFTAIGAFKAVTLGYFDPEQRKYLEHSYDEQVEVLSFAGDITATKDDSGPLVHAHVVIGRRDGSACGGHLMHATVNPTLEVILEETPAHLRRTHDPATGLALIDLDRSEGGSTGQ